MNVDDLDRFIRAYGDPYGGANTCLSNAKVKIENVEKSKMNLLDILKKLVAYLENLKIILLLV